MPKWRPTKKRPRVMRDDIARRDASGSAATAVERTEYFMSKKRKEKKIRQGSLSKGVQERLQ